jgi:acetyl-CoA synthetase
VTPFPGAIETKPGSATVPFFGIETAILDPISGEVSLNLHFTPFLTYRAGRQELHGNGVEGILVIKHPWPSIARTIYQDHKRYQETYMQVCPFSPIFV